MNEIITYDPKFNRTDAELEAFFLFCICVAGKNADRTIRAINRFFSPTQKPSIYLQKLCRNKTLRAKLKEQGFGQYNRIERAIAEWLSLGINLKTCSIEDLEQIHGIGSKTSRMFVSFTRPKVNVAILDVHILRWLRSKGIDAPKQTPSGKKYLALEQIYLKLAKQEKRNPITMDYEIWKESRASKGIVHG